MNFSVEVEGVDFILRFRDEASDQINVAEKGYQRLVSAMQSLISTQRAFSDSTIETLSLASQALKNNPFPIATPLTISPDQISLMAQFEGRATAWFQKMSNQMLGYLNRVRRATIETNRFRDSIMGIVNDFKALGKGLTSVVPIIEHFSHLKLPELGSKTLQTLLKDIQSVIRSMLDWAKVSPEFRKAVGLNEESLSRLSSTMNNVQGSAQKSNFHTRDFRDALKGAGSEADKATSKFGALGDIFDKLAGAKFALGGILTGLALGKGVQQFATLEDAAFSVRQKVGDVAGSVDSLILKFRQLSRDSGYSAQSIAGAFAMIAEKSGRVNKGTEALAVLAVTFSRLTGASAELAGELTGTLVGAFGLTEEAAGQILQMANQARKGARNLMGPEFVQFMTHNIELMRKLAQTTGHGTDVGEFLKKNASSMMALQKEYAVIYGDAQQVTAAMQGAVSIVGEDATKLRFLLSGTGKTYQDFVEQIKSDKLDEAFLDLAESWQKRINQQPEDLKAVFRKQFSLTSGIAEDQLNQLERINSARIRSTRKDLDDIKKRTEAWNKGAAEFRQTFSGILERLSAIWSYFQMVMAPTLKLLLQGLDKILGLLTTISQIKFLGIGKAFDFMIGGLITGFEIFWAARGVKYFFSLFGSRGILKDLGAFTKGLRGSATAEVGNTGLGSAEAQAARLSTLRSSMANSEGVVARLTSWFGRLRSSIFGVSGEFETLGARTSWFDRLGSKFINSKFGRYLFEGVDTTKASGLLKYMGRFGKAVGGVGFAIGNLASINEAYEKEGISGAVIAASKFAATATALFPRLMAGIATRFLPRFLVEGLIGRMAGRVIPYVGWALLAKDAVNIIASIDGWLAKKTDSGIARWARLVTAPIKELSDVLDLAVEKLKSLMGLDNEYEKLKSARSQYTPPSKMITAGAGSGMVPGGLGLGLAVQMYKWAWEKYKRDSVPSAQPKTTETPTLPSTTSSKVTPKADASPSIGDQKTLVPEALRPDFGTPQWQQNKDEELKKNFLEQKGDQDGVMLPAAFVPRELPTPLVQQSSTRGNNSDVSAVLRKVSAENASDDVVRELQKISALIEVALRRIGTRSPMTPKYGLIAEGSV